MSTEYAIIKTVTEYSDYDGIGGPGMSKSHEEIKRFSSLVELKAHLVENTYTTALKELKIYELHPLTVQVGFEIK